MPDPIVMFFIGQRVHHRLYGAASVAFPTIYGAPDRMVIDLPNGRRQVAKADCTIAWARPAIRLATVDGQRVEARA